MTALTVGDLGGGKRQVVVGGFLRITRLRPDARSVCCRTPERAASRSPGLTMYIPGRRSSITLSPWRTSTATAAWMLWPATIRQSVYVIEHRRSHPTRRSPV